MIAENTMRLMDENIIDAQVALLMTICTYLRDDEAKFSSTEIRLMLQDAIDLIE